MKIVAELKQTLGLKLSQEMQQSLEILQMSSIDIIAYLTEKYEMNPLLQLEFAEEHLPSKFEKQYFVSTLNISKHNKSFRDITATPHFQIQSTISIEDFLMEQIPFKNPLTKNELRVLKFLIRNLNSHGYLEIEMDAVAKLFNISLEQVHEVLYFLQGLAPKGIGARTLEECLILQCHNNDLAERMIMNCFHLVKMRNLKKIARECNVSLIEVEATYDFIASLNPRPLQNLQTPTTMYITPDVTVLKIANDWDININKKHLPKVTMDDFYLNMVQASGEDTRAYLIGHYKEAKVLLQGLVQREQTLYHLVAAIIQFQGDCFERGLTSFKPMGLTDIAKIMNMHESTVSRAASGKYIRTPHGTYALASLFTRGIVDDEGNTRGISQIKEYIQNLINIEDRSNPYSDQKISELLKNDQIIISRRTVAKYREEMNIRSSSKRVKYS